MIDAVLGYHLNPFSCGVAKFNRRLAEQLGVAFDSYGKIHQFAHPLVSLKASEMAVDWFPGSGVSIKHPYDLLLHDRPYPTLPWQQWIGCANRVFYADELGCPATVDGNPHRGAYRVLTFGMAHKLVLPHFAALKERLDREHPDYTLSLSTAVHEGSPWDTALTDAEAAMRGIFGDRLRVLGFLADDALARELQECDAVAAFFVPAVRANNTSIWAAVEAGKTIYTNTDEHSPDLTQPPTWERVAEVFRA